MRILATHDTQGNIHHIVMGPADSPPAVVTAEPGLLVTEVEAPEELADLDLSDPQIQRHLDEVLRNFRVEAQAEARLVRDEGWF
jgi:hypothetical protein